MLVGDPAGKRSSRSHGEALEFRLQPGWTNFVLLTSLV
jgi:hypothetical protein